MTHGTPSRRAGGAQAIPRPVAWRAGGVAPWQPATPLTAADVAASVAATNGTRLRSVPQFPGAHRSAVLVALVDGADGAQVLLTKRAADLRHHPGEISFPGGRLDADETPIEAALREADEEVGLPPLAVRVAGTLSALSTVVSSSFIIPVVAVVAAHPPLVAHDREVARIMWVPLAELASADTYREEHWGTPPLDRRMDFFDLDDETVWGATARILRELLDVAYGPPAMRTAP